MRVFFSARTSRNQNKGRKGKVFIFQKILRCDAMPNFVDPEFPPKKRKSVSESGHHKKVVKNHHHVPDYFIKIEGVGEKHLFSPHTNSKPSIYDLSPQKRWRTTPESCKLWMDLFNKAQRPHSTIKREYGRA